MSPHLNARKKDILKMRMNIISYFIFSSERKPSLIKKQFQARTATRVAKEGAFDHYNI
ncbi:hypothetical protein SAMN06295933_1137 [Desulfovibrio gilichinskyi]|uniref:Uncharacterized protein n=1 Tax=Desulfovibrio gilichinskyi TaxID=1519643 RepID=A0A1X7CRA7_9BACT|nr:hypothetical protein SAMN06295933_1137 [Desulfovibrio gilichinskyi]